MRLSASALGADFVQTPQGEELEWQDKAACIGMEDWIFFPSPGDATVVRWAKKVCRGCPVMQECQDWALSRGEEYGIWGGLSDRDRRAYWKAHGRRTA